MVTIEQSPKMTTIDQIRVLSLYLEVIANLLTLGGLYLFTIAIVQAYNNPAIINYNANGTLIIQGVNFRDLLTALLLTGSRNYFGAAKWLGRKVLVKY